MPTLSFTITPSLQRALKKQAAAFNIPWADYIAVHSGAWVTELEQAAGRGFHRGLKIDYRLTLDFYTYPDAKTASKVGRRFPSLELNFIEDGKKFVGMGKALK